MRKVAIGLFALLLMGITVLFQKSVKLPVSQSNPETIETIEIAGDGTGTTIMQ